VNTCVLSLHKHSRMSEGVHACVLSLHKHSRMSEGVHACVLSLHKHSRMSEVVHACLCSASSETFPHNIHREVTTTRLHILTYHAFSVV